LFKSGLKGKWSHQKATSSTDYIMGEGGVRAGDGAQKIKDAYKQEREKDGAIFGKTKKKNGTFRKENLKEGKGETLTQITRTLLANRT